MRRRSDASRDLRSVAAPSLDRCSQGRCGGISSDTVVLAPTLLANSSRPPCRRAIDIAVGSPSPDRPAMDARDFAWMLEAIAESLDDRRRHPPAQYAQRDREPTIGLEPDVEAQGAADRREADGVRQRVEQNEPDLQLVGEEARSPARRRARIASPRSVQAAPTRAMMMPI